MHATLSPETVGPGRPAPNFSLPLVSAEGPVTLADYRDRTPLFLVLLRSFECPFCRRTLAALKSVGDAMAERGIETLVVTTTPEREARLYTRYRPPGLPLASDPSLGIHRAFGVPIYRFTSDGPTRWPREFNPSDFSKLVVTGATDAWDQGVSVLDAGQAIATNDGFEKIDTDEDGPPDDVSPLVTFFMIDRAGIVRWAFTEALENPAEYGAHPSREVFHEAAKTVL